MYSRLYLNVISMTRTINMSIMPVSCLIFNMCCVDCYTTSLLFWGIVNVSVGLVVCCSLLS